MKSLIVSFVFVLLLFILQFVSIQGQASKNEANTTHKIKPVSLEQHKLSQDINYRLFKNAPRVTQVPKKIKKPVTTPKSPKVVIKDTTNIPKFKYLGYIQTGIAKTASLELKGKRYLVNNGDVLRECRVVKIEEKALTLKHKNKQYVINKE